MDLNALGRVVIITGILLMVVGGMLVIFSKLPILKHLGHLPGDIRIQSTQVSCFFPITSMIIISILLSLALNLLLRLLNRL